MIIEDCVVSMSLLESMAAKEQPGHFAVAESVLPQAGHPVDHPAPAKRHPAHDTHKPHARVPREENPKKQNRSHTKDKRVRPPRVLVRGRLRLSQPAQYGLLLWCHRRNALRTLFTRSSAEKQPFGLVRQPLERLRRRVVDVQNIND